MAPGERTVDDVQRGPGTTVPGNHILDQDGRPVDDAFDLPSIDSTPRRSEPLGEPPLRPRPGQAARGASAGR